jgi:hypothetical protein
MTLCLGVHSGAQAQRFNVAEASRFGFYLIRIPTIVGKRFTSSETLELR